jgi:ribosomal protein S18 acetylase RimI-like enzyme
MMPEQSYLKVPFWEEPQAAIAVPDRLQFISVKAFALEVLVSAIAQVMSSSIDARDRKKVSLLGAERAAKQFLDETSEGFFYQDEWWQFGVNNSQKIVGFVLPVVYRDNNNREDKLPEGTIYYIGVLPEYRGLCFANDLLFQGTQILQNIGVWRVFCDTDINNIPMISTFKKVGYRQYGEPWKRPL